MANKIKIKRQKKGRQSAGQPRSSSSPTLLQQALAFHQAGHLPQAEALYRQILATEPNHPGALQYLGVLAHQTGKSEIGVKLLSKVLSRRPDYTDAHVSLGVILHDLGKLDEAAASFRRALDLKPDYAEAHSNLGNVLRDQGKLGEAIASFRQALRFKPDSAELHYNLGNALKDQGEMEKAAASYRRALFLKPDFATAHYHLGNALESQGTFEDAAASYRQALRFKSDNAATYYHLGNALKDQGKLEEAVANYRQALALKPDNVDAWNNLGFILNNQGEPEEAIACFRRVLALKPNYAVVHSNLLTCLNYLPDQSTAEYLDEACRYGRRAASKVGVRFSDWRCAVEPERLRVGLVSGDFLDHPVGYFLENVLANIDPTRMELFAYPTHHEEDALTGRIRSRFAAWRPLSGVGDEAAARLIHDDGVHVLLDLAGHTANNRLPIFAWKPAPVQATWLGYSASTGLAEMDYLIADPVSVPESYQEHLLEKVWYLPETRFCFSPPMTGEETAFTPLPALANGYITLGCFQNLTKINDKVLALWGRILRALPQARFRLQTFLLDIPAIREQLRQRFARYGVAPERIALVKGASRKEYLAAYAHVDLLLDTFPFPGGTTTCEALWMGVPTVTLAGKTMLARQGASLLACAGLPDWIATNAEDYVAKAVAHASDLEKLDRLRAGLQRQVSASPLFDAPRFSRNFEMAMWGMWEAYQAEHRSR
ncbi:MAG: tetratricopeptide repeat protein [Deltaproteobacteria bacterium]